ncbi:glycoside hydrolase family 16 protein [Paxillus rubicundulus Ve08.2h10]|uniref:Glycoside hydrolase family 16 protein n=1 Tax=Paxillus rubicundulus Ve08.2h10 TaxID=930991 RepID=A0A0D0DMA7_9AGAM|nr:glycoside hydrolase family 16 protein [Paxillus rubicundulus Ve08.2h10]
MPVCWQAPHLHDGSRRPWPVQRLDRPPTRPGELHLCRCVRVFPCMGSHKAVSNITASHVDAVRRALPRSLGLQWHVCSGHPTSGAGQRRYPTPRTHPPHHGLWDDSIYLDKLQSQPGSASTMLGVYAFHHSRSIFLSTCRAFATKYPLSTDICGPGFYDEFRFETTMDPTHGRVIYVNKRTAQQLNFTCADDVTFFVQKRVHDVYNGVAGNLTTFSLPVTTL